MMNVTPPYIPNQSTTNNSKVGGSALFGGGSTITDRAPLKTLYNSIRNRVYVYSNKINIYSQV